VNRVRPSLTMSLGVGAVGVAAVALVVIAVFYGFGGRTRVQATETQLVAAQSQLQDLRLRASRLERQTKQLQDQLLQAEQRLAAAQKQSDLLQDQLPLGPVTGPGIVVELTEALPAQGERYAPAQLVHAADLLELTNSLATAGAKAVTINGIRVALLGSIECQGPKLIVRGEHLFPPYRIQAIGDPRTLAAVLRTPGGVADRLRNFGINVLVRQDPKLQLPPLLPEAAPEPLASTTTPSEGAP